MTLAITDSRYYGLRTLHGGPQTHIFIVQLSLQRTLWCIFLWTQYENECLLDLFINESILMFPRVIISVQQNKLTLPYQVELARQPMTRLDQLTRSLIAEASSVGLQPVSSAS